MSWARFDYFNNIPWYCLTCGVAEFVKLSCHAKEIEMLSSRKSLIPTNTEDCLLVRRALLGKSVSIPVRANKEKS